VDKVTHGHIDVIWDTDYRNYEYIKQPLKEVEMTKWRSLGYYHESFSGGMYDSRQPMPDWTKTVAEKIGLTNAGFVFYKMQTLDIMPNHVDHFETYCRVFEVDRKDVYRALLFLEDWSGGQYLEANHKAITNWKAGDFVLWQADIDHASSNIGTKDRYALQITGTLIDGRFK
tara:strand:+ start:248 stop:763 length:516 start_codon:yes stop_codon:yes gene_type:complete